MRASGSIYYLFVYILECSDGSYYTGVTNNLDKRILQHQNGLNPEAYTFTRRPVKLVFWEGFADANYAIQWEKRIKKWSRKKKEALIEGRFEHLPYLAKKKFKKK